VTSNGFARLRPRAPSAGEIVSRNAPATLRVGVAVLGNLRYFASGAFLAAVETVVPGGQTGLFLFQPGNILKRRVKE
jgi:hypothetical protein